MEQYCLEYGRFLQVDKKVSKNTYESYMRDTQAFVDNCAGRNPLTMTHDDFVRYCDVLRAQHKSDATIVRVLASLRSFYGFLQREGYIDSNPVASIRVTQKNKKLPAVLTQTQVADLLAAPRTDTHKGLRDKAMLELIYATGIRVGELIALNIADVDADVGLLACRSGRSSRFIPIYPGAVQVLRRYIETARPAMALDSTEALFVNMGGSRLTRQGFWKIIKAYAKEARVDGEITPHTLRHSFAEHLYENGASLQDLQGILGHADIASTKVYAAIAKSRYKDVYAHFHPRAVGVK